MKIDTYPIVVVKLDDAEGGGFLALAPDLHGCMGDGETQESAVADLRNAIAEWLDEAVSAGIDIPQPGSQADAARTEIDALYDLIAEQGDMIERLEGAVKNLREATRDALQRRPSRLMTIEHPGVETSFDLTVLTEKSVLLHH